MMYYCVGPEVGSVVTKADCIADPRNKWMNQRYNFDNIGHVGFTSFIQLFFSIIMMFMDKHFYVVLVQTVLVQAFLVANPFFLRR